jgi:protein phosphatase
MGTTLVAAVFAGASVAIGNVGDSRCYRLRDGSIEILTQDHSFAAQLSRTGVATSRSGRIAAMQWAHVLTRCMNGDKNAVPDTLVTRSEPGDVYLLCSDGLWGCASDAVIGGILADAQDAQDACERLIRAAWGGGGLDNIGIAVVRVSPMQLRLGDPSSHERESGLSGHVAELESP